EAADVQERVAEPKPGLDLQRALAEDVRRRDRGLLLRQRSFDVAVDPGLEQRELEAHPDRELPVAGRGRERRGLGEMRTGGLGRPLLDLDVPESGEGRGAHAGESALLRLLR